MSIQGIENGSVDWSAVLGKALSDKGIGAADNGTSVVLDGDNVTISVRDPASGEAVSRTLELPTLNPDSLEADVAGFLLTSADELDQLVQGLKTLASEVGETEPQPGETSAPSPDVRTTDAQKALFSIYELMNLMQQIAQQQRDSAREIRLTELQSEVASIKSQAAHQRQAAVYGMIVSAVTTAVQGAMLFGTSVASVKGLQKLDQTGAGQGLSQAKADVKTLETALQSPSDATAHATAVAGKSSDTVKANVDERLTDVTAAKGRLETAQKALADAPADAENRAQLEQAVTDAKAAYGQKLNDALAKMDADYGRAAEATKAAEGKYVSGHSLKHPVNTRANYKAMGEAQQAQSALGSERTLLRAKVAEAKAQLGDVEGLTADLAAARGGVKVAETVLKTDPGYHLASSDPAASGAYQQLTQMIGTVGQGLAQLVQANEEAKGTEEQAAQKELEARRQETNDLFQQAQELISSVRELLKAVIQAESQSVEQIIRA